MRGGLDLGERIAWKVQATAILVQVARRWVVGRV